MANSKGTKAKTDKNNNKKKKTHSKGNSNNNSIPKKVDNNITSKASKKQNIDDTFVDSKTKILNREIKGIILIAIAAFLIFAINQSGQMGIAGEWFKNLLNSLMGKGMYLFPFSILFIGILQLLNILLYSEKRQVISVIGIFVCILVIFSIADGNNTNFNIFDKSLTDTANISIDTNNIGVFGGGLIGNIIAWILYKIVGIVGAYIIISAVILVFLIIFTNQSLIGFFKLLFSLVKKFFQKIYDFIFVEVEEEIDIDHVKNIDKKIMSNKKVDNNKDYTIVDIPENNTSNKDIINFELNDTSIKGIKNKEITKLKIEDVESEYFDRDEDSRQLNFTDIKDDYNISPSTEKDKNNVSNGNFSKNDLDVAGKTVEEYKLPSSTLLKLPKKKSTSGKEDLRKDADKLIQTLKNFNIECSISQISKGPTITRYEILPAPGIKVSKITSLQNDIALNLATSDIRMEAPIPGKSAIGIEVPNKEKADVLFRGLVESNEFKEIETKIPFALGKDIAGKNIIGSIEKMPHLLVAGATGSGKSVCINTLIMSILFKANPDEVKLILVDPKVVELSVYNGIPHLLIPVVTDPRKASNALNWAVSEMTTRYKVFAQNSVRDIFSYNNKMLKENKPEEKMPQIVIIIDELADLMQVAPGEVEECITRIAQLARACGIHLVIATQRPSVDVITGTIKANIPSRIAFAVSSFIDSRTILDSGGAEKLLGKGDMLYHPIGLPKPIRIQGTFISDDEIKAVVDFIKEQNIQQKINNINAEIDKTPASNEKVDDLLEQAIELVVNEGQASASYLQRRFSIGYNRAARLIEAIEERGIISGADGSKPRKVLITKEELEEMKNTNE